MLTHSKDCERASEQHGCGFYEFGGVCKQLVADSLDVWPQVLLIPARAAASARRCPGAIKPSRPGFSQSCGAACPAGRPQRRWSP